MGRRQIFGEVLVGGLPAPPHNDLGARFLRLGRMMTGFLPGAGLSQRRSCQSPCATQELVSRITDDGGDDEDKQADADTGDDRLDPGDLLAEEIPNFQPANGVEQGTDRIHEKKSRRIHSRHAGQGRDERADAGEEL